MPRITDETLTFQRIYESPIVSIRNYDCRACLGGSKGEEYSNTNDIVLIRSGVFRKHLQRNSMTVDVNQAAFFSRGTAYHVSHPTDRGDRGTVFTLDSRTLNDMIRDHDPSVDDNSDRPFPFVTGPCDSAVFWTHLGLVQRLENAERDPLEPLWVDITALELMGKVIENSFILHGRARSRRTWTYADHVDRIESAKTILAARIGEHLSLDEIAGAVQISPFHFSRMFRKHTGLPLHRYLMRLRLRTSLEMLAEGVNDLTALALDLGFSSHSHFSDAFRREFGLAPSKVRLLITRRRLHEMSKNLKV